MPHDIRETIVSWSGVQLDTSLTAGWKRLLTCKRIQPNPGGLRWSGIFLRSCSRTWHAPSHRTWCTQSSWCRSRCRRNTLDKVDKSCLSSSADNRRSREVATHLTSRLWQNASRLPCHTSCNEDRFGNTGNNLRTPFYLIFYFIWQHWEQPNFLTSFTNTIIK